MSAGLRGNGVVAVLREAKSKWERRAPITPEHVSALVRSGVRVLVQPSERTELQSPLISGF
jgi:alanine dehydrogenase